MSDAPSLFVAEPVLHEDATFPTADELVAWAGDLRADRLAVRARSGSEGWAVVGPGDRAPSLEEVMLAAHRAGLGLVVRIAATDVIPSLAAGLGIMGVEGPAELRRRYLVVVPDARIGKRLRLEASELPSAREISSAAGLRNALRRRAPNLARAAADADDLVVPAAAFPPARVRDALVPQLRRRGAYVWVADVPPEDRSAYESLGAGGLLVPLPFPG